MLLSTPAKTVYATCILSLFFAGCSLWRSNENSAVNISLPVTRQLPFATREPDVFQAEILIRSGDVERRIGIARSGLSRRIDYDIDTPKHRAVVISDKEYLLDMKRKTYVEREFSATEAGDSELVSHLLTLRDYTEFDEVGRNGSVIQFRARINDTTASDVMIFFDESIGLPIRQEFYAIEGEVRKLHYSMELRGFSTQVDQTVFQIPKEFRGHNRRQ